MLDFTTPIFMIYKYNVSIKNTALFFCFICNKISILSGRHVSTFIRSSSGPLGKQIQELTIFQCIVASHNAYRLCYLNVKYITLYICMCISHSYNTVCKRCGIPQCIEIYRVILSLEVPNYCL